MYQIVLIGVHEFVTRAEAIKNLALLFNATSGQVEVMLANPMYVLKKGLAENIALQYKTAIEAAGGVCQVVQEKSAGLTFNVNFTQSATNQENPKNNQQFTNEFAADNRSEATLDNDAHLNNDTEREKTLWQKLLGKSLITKIVLVFGGILILAGLAISLADVVVHKQNDPASKSTATAGIAAENKIPVTLNGIYRLESGNSIVTEIYYPDGAYIETTWFKVKSNDKPMFFSILVGMCRQNGTQLDCRLTGDASAATVLLDGRTDINQKDFRSNDFHTEVTDLIRMNNDGSFSKKRIKIVLDGGQPPPLDDKWSDKYIPAHSENEEKVKNDMRQLVPVQFFTAQQPNNVTAYLDKNAAIINWLVLRPTEAIVLLTEPCGVQKKYLKAKVFGYENGKIVPSVEHSGCYNDNDRELGPNGKIKVVESDGTSIGKLIVEVPVSEAFTPKNYFLPLDNDPRNTLPKIEALGVILNTTQFGTDFDTIGLTRQVCPFDKTLLLARHIPVANADGYERCWMEKGQTIVIRDVDYPDNIPTLSKNETSIDKNYFFAASTVSNTPLKYKWSNY